MMVATAAYVLMTVTAPGGAPTISEAAKQLGVQPSDIDSAFGVVPIDPKQGKYAVQARPESVSGSSTSRFAGPYSNPRIESFGPIEK